MDLKQSVQATNRPAEMAADAPADRAALPGSDHASRTVVRALGLLDVVVAEPSGLGLSEIARRAGLSKATAFRMLGALKQAQLVVQDATTGQYQPGLKIIGMAHQMLRALDFPAVAHPYLAELAQELGHAVMSGVLERGEIVYLDHVQGSHELRVHRDIGVRRPLHVSSMARAIMAFLPSAEADGWIDACGFEPHTPHTTVDPSAYRAQLGEVRRRGWALIRDEAIDGASSFSGPVFDRTGRVIGSIGISLPSLALAQSNLNLMAGRLLEACRAVSIKLGHDGSSRGSEGTGVGEPEQRRDGIARHDLAERGDAPLR
jgi:DNA-binding IclR family transcriptional regulator